MEILIAAALLSILLSCAFFSFSSIRRNMARGGRTFESYRKWTLISKRLELLIARASPYRQVSPEHQFIGDSSSLSFTSLRGETESAAPRFIELEKKGDSLLLHSDSFRPLLKENEDGKEFLEELAKVEALEFSYKGIKDEVWKSRWDSKKQKRLPRLVKIQLEIINDNGLKLPSTLVFPTRLQKDPSIP